MWSRNLTFVENNPIRLGGPHVIVQIDETKLNHNVKSHRGRGPIRAIVDTFTQPVKGFATMIPDRRAEAIIPIIESVVHPWSIIHTDEAKAYRALGESLQNYEHSTVCHKYNFVDSVTGVHTQHVESWNNKIKTQIKDMRGMDEDNRSNMLSEFIFFGHFKNSTFEQILLLLQVDIS